MSSLIETYRKYTRNGNTTQRRKLVQLQADYKILQSKNVQIKADAKEITDSKIKFDKQIATLENEVKKAKSIASSKDNALKSLTTQLANARKGLAKVRVSQKSNKRKVKKTTKRKSYSTPLKKARQIRKERTYKRLIAEKNSILKKIGSKRSRTGLYKEMIKAKDIIGRKKREKAVREVQNKFREYKSLLMTIEHKLKRLK